MTRFVLFAAALFAWATVSAAAQDEASAPGEHSKIGITVSTGLDYSSGRYGDTQSTDTLVGLNSVTFAKGNFQFIVSMPYLTITGPAYAVVGAGGVPVIIRPKAGSSATERAGWGDLGLSTLYTIPAEDFYDFEITLTGRTKIATANSSKGLSTGATDFGFSVDVSRQLDDWGPFVTLGYSIPGSPSFYAFNDAPSFSVGTSYQISDSIFLIGSYDFDGSISSSLPDAQQIFSSASWVLDDHWTATAYAEFGLSSGAPKIGTGLVLSWKIP